MKPGFTAVLLALVLSMTSAAFAAERSIIVLDGSGSMWGQIDGKTKIEIARETLRTVLDSVPPENETGLMVYGHRAKGDCKDIELAVPPAKGTAKAISAFADGINPKGKTPITAAVGKAAEALQYTEEKATVILVTDGLETCDADPCALAKDLEAKGVDFTVHVVGFGLSDEEGRTVACLAEETGGKYLKAEDAGSLGDALRETVAEAPAPKPEPKPQPVKPEFNLMGTAALVEGGPDLDDNNVRWDIYPVDVLGKTSANAAHGQYGSTLEASLPAGRYLMRTRLGKVVRESEIELKESDVSRQHVVFDAGIVKLTPKRRRDDETPEKNARVTVSWNGGEDGAYGEGRFYVPAGSVTLRGKIGKAVAEEQITLNAGETVEKTLVIASGIVVPSAVYAEGGPAVESNDIRFTVLEAAKDLNGKRKKIDGQYGSGRGIEVPAGQAVLHARLGEAEVTSDPFTVKGGERTEVQVDINAGVMAISAPGAYRIDLFEGKKDMQGKQRRITGNYGEQLQVTLHPGDYEVVATFQDGKPEKRKPATVTAGKRVETTLE